MTPRPRRVVYVTYDGLGDPLGQSQVLPYVRGLAARGHRFDLVSFEKPGAPLAFARPIAPGVRWTALRYHKTPTVPATLFDMGQGLALAGLAALVGRADLVHVRSYVSATLAAPLAVGARVPLLFDTRGLWADEKVDAGAWPRDGGLYRATKRVERRLFGLADGVTVLTNALRRYLRERYEHRDELRAPIAVIPTCADLALFSPLAAPDPTLAAALAGARTLAYVGSFGTWYMGREMASFYLAWRRAVAPRAARFLVVTRDDPAEVAAVLREAGAEGELVVRAARNDQVPALVRAADAAVCFIRPFFSKLGSAPTKLGELLGCGLPVAANLVGDMAEVLAGSPAGVVVGETSPAALDAAARALADAAARPDTSAAARALAERWFGLDRALDAYDALYARLPRRHGLGPAGPPDDRGWPAPLPPARLAVRPPRRSSSPGRGGGRARAAWPRGPRRARRPRAAGGGRGRSRWRPWRRRRRARRGRRARAGRGGRRG
ncbi:MAG TPA: glycosyltransferase [Polyangiaceae bacterium]|nr:glycosyltransferase [Polyangiaceae bacterium]